MMFLDKIKYHGVIDLEVAGTEERRDEIKGKMLAERDFREIFSQPAASDMEKILPFMKERALREKEQEISDRLLEETNPRNERKLFSWWKRYKELHKQFLEYAEKGIKTVNEKGHQ